MKKIDFHPIFCHLYAVVVVLVIFGVYLKTLAPTVSFFDSGELISAAYTLGVAHPPGYPLYVLVGWLFSKMPIGNVAYRLNLMSACFGALAALMAYYLTYLLISDRQLVNASGPPSSSSSVERLLYPVIAMIVALTFAFSLTHWRQAVIAEVYSLNAFLCGLVLLVLFFWHKSAASMPAREVLEEKAETPSILQEPDDTTDSESRVVDLPVRVPSARLLYLAAFLFGLGFGNHQMIALLALAAVFLVLRTDWRIVLRWKSLLLIGLCLVLGFTVYLQVPIRARANPPINWGNAETLRQFRWLIMRKGYANVERGHAVRKFWEMLRGHGPLAEEPAPEAEQSPEAISLFRQIRASLLYQQLATFNPLREFGYFGVALALIGGVYGIIRIRIPTLTLVVALVTLVVGLVLIGDPPPENIFLVEEFHTPAYLSFSVLIGLGIAAIAQGMLWLSGGVPMLQYVAVFVLAGVSLILPTTQMLAHLPEVDRHQNYVAYDYGSNILRSLQPNAILFTWGDSGAFPLWYLHYVEELRPDVTLIHTPHLSSDWYVKSLPPELFISANPFDKHQGNFLAILDEIVQKNAPVRPIYFDYSSSHALVLPYELIPHGIVYKMAMPGDVLDENVWSTYRLRGIMSFSLTARDLDRLQQEPQITDKIVPKLYPLLDQVFDSESEFLAGVAQYLGNDLTQKYRDFLLIHAVFQPHIARDQDINRTFLLYGSAHLELGNFYLEAGEVEKAAAQFNAAVRFDSSLGNGIVQMLQFRDKMAGSHPVITGF